jgi:hypothetical protein
MPQRMKKNQKQNVPRKAQNMRKPDQRQKLAAEFNSMYRPMLTSSEPRKRSNGTVQLSKCALKYALAIASPFNVAARGACIPTVPAPESFKTTGFIRGTAFIGTAGVGYILVAPCLAKDMPALFCTNALYTGTSTLILSATNTLVPGIVPLNVSGTPFISSNFVGGNDGQPNVSGRCVSAGLSVQYVGTLMNTSGVVYALRDPSHNNVSLTATGGITGASAQSLGLRNEASVCPFTSEKCTVVDFSADMAETGYPLPNQALSFPRNATHSIYPYCNANDSYGLTSGVAFGTYSVTGLTVGAATSIILFTGVPGSAVQFEYVQHCEYIGPGAASLVSSSESDLPGLSKVLGAAETIVERSNAQPKATRWGLMRDSLAEIARATAPVVLPMMESAVMALLA